MIDRNLIVFRSRGQMLHSFNASVVSLDIEEEQVEEGLSLLERDYNNDPELKSKNADRLSKLIYRR